MFTSILSSKSDKRITKSLAECVWGDVVYALKVSKRRRSIGFQVQAKAITVTVPYGLSEALLHEALEARHAWLVSKLEQMQQHIEAAMVLPTQLNDSESWPVFGDWLPVHITEGKVHGIKLAEQGIEVVFTSRQASQACRWRLWQQWYRLQALAFAQQRVNYWFTQMAADLPQQPASISVRQYRRRWGSCSSAGELKFNYLLSMVPKEVFDYVVVHEMCHLKHMHHGSAFWRLVTDYCPHWRQQRQWLKQHGPGLLMELST